MPEHRACHFEFKRPKTKRYNPKALERSGVPPSRRFRALKQNSYVSEMLH